MAEELEQAIRDNAQGPAEAHGDSGGMKQHKPRDQIEADRYLSAKRAARSKTLGLRMTRIVPPGAA